MDEQLFQVHARCPLASKLGDIHQVSRPMSWADANMTLLQWTMAVTAPDWTFAIKEAEAAAVQE